jgi:death-on-curing protein
LLESALARPRNIHAYNPAATLAEMAASYCYGIAKNHAFVDGNKRAAFLCIGLFLAINGCRLTASQVDSIEIVLGVAAGTASEPELAMWIARNSKER